MSSVSTKTWPSQRATPRLATMPKFRKTATSSGVQRHLTLPVVASSAQTLSSFVVRYSVPFDSTGYDCSPRRTLESIWRKSTVNSRPSWATFPVPICVSGECRFSSGVLPKPPQPTSVAVLRAAAPPRTTPDASDATNSAPAHHKPPRVIAATILRT